MIGAGRKRRRPLGPPRRRSTRSSRCGHTSTCSSRAATRTAAEDLTPQLLDSLGGETIWISERIADLLIDAQLDARVVEETDRTATVRVDSLRTESLSRGCTDFSGTYSMVRSGDRWLISSADLVESPC